MTSNGIGPGLFVIGFIVVGAPVLFFLYKLVLRICGRTKGQNQSSSAESPRVTPHHLVVALAVVGVLFLVPILLQMTTFPEWKIGYGGLLVWALLFVGVFAGEKAILKLQSYKNSWWCRPLGRETQNEE